MRFKKQIKYNLDSNLQNRPRKPKKANNNQKGKYCYNLNNHKRKSQNKRVNQV